MSRKKKRRVNDVGCYCGNILHECSNILSYTLWQHCCQNTCSGSASWTAVRVSVLRRKVWCVCLSDFHCVARFSHQSDLTWLPSPASPSLATWHVNGADVEGSTGNFKISKFCANRIWSSRVGMRPKCLTNFCCQAHSHWLLAFDVPSSWILSWCL